MTEYKTTKVQKNKTEFKKKIKMQKDAKNAKMLKVQKVQKYKNKKLSGASYYYKKAK